MRALLLAALVVITAASPAAAEGDQPTDPQADHHGGRSGQFDRPYEGFAPPSTVLRDGTPARVGLDPAPIDAALRQLAAWTEPAGTTKPMYAGAVALLAHDGVVVSRHATGHALRYADGNGTELPRDQWVPMRTDSIFDMASVSKLFASIVLMQQVERGVVDLDAPVARYVREYAANGKGGVVVRQLVTHTSGMRSWLPLWRDHPTPQARIAATLADTLQAPPGTRYTYSDLNLITLGVLLERVTGHPLDVLVRDGITGPLRMHDTGYNPDPAKLPRIAATEYQASPPRGMVRGSVHDENAWALGGVSGHAGIFSTADDMAVFGQMILNGGTYRGARILSPDSVTAALTNYNTTLPSNAARGVGFELNQYYYMGALVGHNTAGHTGYTGTSLVIDPLSRSVVVLLTNRVHPSRNWTPQSLSRRVVATALAEALAVEPRHHDTAWFSGLGDARTSTLAVDLAPRRAGRMHVGFDLFVDTERTDVLYLESSVDGGQTWEAVPFSTHGPGAPGHTEGSVSGAGHRSWWRAWATLPGDPDQPVRLRWRYTTDALYTGRGVYVDGVKVRDVRGVLLDGERHPEAFTTDGWSLRSR
jgi:CubicO group peptidase (beta-lactamase class C family)